MPLEEAVKQFTDELRTATNRVGKKEVIVKLLPDKRYHAYVAEPDWKPGQEIVYGQQLGIYLNLEDVEKSFADLPFASDIDPNGWVVSPEKSLIHTLVTPGAR